jgi:hypothetical protein
VAFFTAFTKGSKSRDFFFLNKDSLTNITRRLFYLKKKKIKNLKTESGDSRFRRLVPADFL